MKTHQTVCFLLLPKVHLMDLSGPAQVFYEASQLGTFSYDLVYAGLRQQVDSEQGLMLGNLLMIDQVELEPGDFIVIPGVDFKSFTRGEMNDELKAIKPWLKKNLDKGVNVATICSGSLILAATGLLNGKKCTSHWKCIDYFRKQYPAVLIQSERLYVQDGLIYTSAGMTSGIDMALSILENQHGPMLPARVAREMVVYLRRNNVDSQESIYLDYRTHFNPAIHKVQDYIISNPGKNPSLEELASVGNVSVRNLTRIFKKATGHTIIEYKNSVKMALAQTLVYNAEYTTEKIASLCGFESVRHFRRIWNTRVGNTVKDFRRVRAT
jgi:transcriptional regulator GlxA family with amidase domain